MSDTIENMVIRLLRSDQTNANRKFVVKYTNTDGDFIGYHKSTACQLTDNKYDAKRYEGDNPERQLAVIHKAVKAMFEISDDNVEHESDGVATIFRRMRLNVRKKYFAAFKDPGEIHLSYEYLDNDAPKQRLVIRKL